MRRRGVGLVTLLVAAVLAAAPPLAASAAQRAGSTTGASRSPAAASLSALPNIATERGWIVGGLQVKTLPPSLDSSVSKEDASEFISKCAENPGGPSAAKACDYGDVHATQTVVLYGNSYAMEWIPAFDALGKLHHFKLITYVRLGCPFADIPTQDWLGTQDKGCLPFRANVVKAINSMHPAPSLVLLGESFNPTTPSGGTISQAQWVKADQTTIKQLHSPIPVTLMLANEHMQFDPGQCLAGNSSNVQACTTAASGDFYGSLDGLEMQGAAQVHAHAADLSILECTTQCPLIAHNLLIHADKAHIDKVFAAAVAPALASLIGCGGVTQPTSLFTKLLPTVKKSAVQSACKLSASATYSY